jgi:hypothetical protein
LLSLSLSVSLQPRYDGLEFFVSQWKEAKRDLPRAQLYVALGNSRLVPKQLRKQINILPEIPYAKAQVNRDSCFVVRFFPFKIYF